MQLAPAARESAIHTHSSRGHRLPMNPSMTGVLFSTLFRIFGQESIMMRVHPVQRRLGSPQYGGKDGL